MSLLPATFSSFRLLAGRRVGGALCAGAMPLAIFPGKHLVPQREQTHTGFVKASPGTIAYLLSPSIDLSFSANIGFVTTCFLFFRKLAPLRVLG